MRIVRGCLALVTVVAMLALSGAPAQAGTLTSASFEANGAYKTTGAINTTYDWSFTTATTSTLSRVTASVPAGTSGQTRYLAVTGSKSNYASAPDSTATDITGDLDIRVKASLTSWANGANQRLVSKWASGGTNQSYALELNGTGYPSLVYSPDGTTQVNRYSTAAVGFSAGTAGWLRVTFQVNSGGNNLAKFYTSSDGTTWTQLGGNVSTAGAATLYNSNAPLLVSSSAGGTYGSTSGKFYYADVRSGIGTATPSASTCASVTSGVCFDPNSTAAAATPSSWTSATGEVWTLNRNGTNRPADIASDLTVSYVSGLAAGTASVRMIDLVALYLITTPVSVPSSTPCTLRLTGFTNTSTAGSYTSTITSFDNAGTPASVDSVTTSSVAFSASSSSVSLTARVEPTLAFTVAGRTSVCNGQPGTNFQTTASATSVDLGRVSSLTVGGGAQDLDVTTNASSGFTVYVKTLGPTPRPLRDEDSHSINDVAGTNASPGAGPVAGTEGFGYTSSDTSTAFTSNKWAKLTATDAPVIIATAGTVNKSACIGYEVAVASTTYGGIYTSVVAYTAVPIF